MINVKYSSSNWMSYQLTFPSNWLLLFLLLALSSLTRGAEENSKQKCDHLEDLVKLFKNTSVNFHDYFGKPLSLPQVFDRAPKCKIFHLQIVNTSKLNNKQTTREACCRWNSEGCYIYVWFKRFYYLLMSPMSFMAIEEDPLTYLPASICISIPSVSHEEVQNIFSDNASSDISRHPHTPVLYI